MTPFLHPWYVDHGLPAVAKLAATNEPFTIDDVVAICGEPPTPNMKGRLLTLAQQLGYCKRTGNSPQSKSPTRRGARIQQWIEATSPVPPVETVGPRQEVLL